MNNPCVILKPGREKSVLRRHPWIFSGAVERVDGQPGIGDTVEVRSSAGGCLGRGAFSPASQIAVRMWTFDAQQEVTPEYLTGRLQRAVRSRDTLVDTREFNAYRLVNGESDGLPGLIVDRYDRFLVCQFLGAGVEKWRDELVAALATLAPGDGICERFDADNRAKEGLPERPAIVHGQPPPPLVEIREGACRFRVNLLQGQKTGFYLDQRENRMLLAAYARDAEVLNAFSYTGGFGVWALRGGAARVTNVDTSADALALAAGNVEANGLDASRVENTEGDAFRVLRKYRDMRRTFDVIVLDPPKFADARSAVPGAARGYKDINLLGFKLLRPGGTLFTFSCSGVLEADLFQKIVSDAALDAGREARILRRLGLPPDHAVSLSFPEGSYLKGLLCR